MRKYLDNCKMTGIKCLCSLKETDIGKRRLLCRVYEYVTSHTGNIYSGKRVEKGVTKIGVTKIGEFFVIDGEATEVMEEPVFYA